MNAITIMENDLLKEYKTNYIRLLQLEKYMVEYFFSWIKLELLNGEIIGKGNLEVNNEDFQIRLTYSPFLPYRFDRIYVVNQSIKYDSSIHVYNDLSLCLYHPVIDKPLGKMIPLVKMIPWISEWCINYNNWKKYKVWLGKEIKHF